MNLNIHPRSYHVPERFWSAEYDKLPSELKEKLSDNPQLDSYLIAGPIGSGKTYAGVAIMRHFIDKGLITKGMARDWQWRLVGYPNSRFITAGDYIDLVQAGYDKGTSQSPQSIRKKFASYSLLMLDDLANHKITDDAVEILSTLINDRWCRVLPTIVTTNLNREGLKKFCPRMESRMSMYVWLPLVGRDRRRDGESK